jgi:TPR repeat protein
VLSERGKTKTQTRFQVIIMKKHFCFLLLATFLFIGFVARADVTWGNWLSLGQNLSVRLSSPLDDSGSVTWQFRNVGTVTIGDFDYYYTDKDGRHFFQAAHSLIPGEVAGGWGGEDTKNGVPRADGTINFEITRIRLIDPTGQTSSDANNSQQTSANQQAASQTSLQNALQAAQQQQAAIQAQQQQEFAAAQQRARQQQNAAEAQRQAAIAASNAKIQAIQNEAAVGTAAIQGIGGIIQDSMNEKRQEQQEQKQQQMEALQQKRAYNDEQIPDPQFVGEFAREDKYEFDYTTKPKALQGDAESQFAVGQLYQGANDIDDAKKWYQKAADQGYQPAKDALLKLNSQNNGIVTAQSQPQKIQSVDEITGIKNLAEQGDAKAQFYLGWKYASGLGVPKDYSKAVDCYRKSAMQGYAVGQYSLGCMYEAG